jgi:hypothetical protein
MGLWIKNADGTIERTAGGGADGQPGVDGEDGQPGVDGNMWHVGSGAPASTLGEPGDYYLDGTDGWVHVKRNDSSWTNLYVNLTGPPGSGGGGDFLPLSGGTLTGGLQVNGQILAAKGSGTAPGLSFASYKGTGFYPGSDNVATYVNGVWQFVVYDDRVRVIRDLQVDGQIKATGGGSKDAPAFQIGPDKALGMFGSTNSQWIRFTTDGEYRFQIGADKSIAYGGLQVNGQIKAQNGSAAAPAYSFTSAPNAGMWHDTGSQKGIHFGVNGQTAIWLRKSSTTGDSPGIYMQGVYDCELYGKTANIAVTSAGQLCRLAGVGRANVRETEAVSHAATNNVYDLQPVWFRSTSNTDNPEHSYYGLIADDCAAIDPRLATYRADEDGVEVADDVNTDAVVALLVSAVKSQRDTIADLTARIETLEGQTRL